MPCVVVIGIEERVGTSAFGNFLKVFLPILSTDIAEVVGDMFCGPRGFGGGDA